MSISSRLNVIVGVCTMSAAVVACSPGSPNATPPPTATSSSIDEFQYGLEVMPASLDVSDNYVSNDMALMGLVTEPLEVPNLDGTFTPVLASEVSQPDPLTLVYDLREDVTFSDGSPMNAADVVWTIEHLQEPDTQTGSELVNISSVGETGEHQVTIKLKEPNNAFRGSLALISFIHDDEYGKANGDDLGTAEAPPRGTGPYVVDEYDADQVVLTRNEQYAGEAPAADRLTFTAVSDDNSAQLAMRSGDLDAFPVIDVKTSSTWQSVPGAQLFSSSTLYVDYISMNTQVAPFDDVHVRRAVSHATDVEGLLEANYGSEADAPRAITPAQILDGLAPDAEALAQVEAPFQQYTFDIEKAKAELAQSGYPDGFTVEYEYYSPPGKLVGLSLQRNLGQIGIDVELKSQRINDFLGDIFAGNAPNFAFFSIAAVVADPSSWYLYLVGRDNPYNVAQFATADTDAAIKVLDESDDEAARWNALQVLTDAMANEVPYVGLAQPNYVLAVGPRATFETTPDFIDMTSGQWIHDLRSTE